MSVVLSYIPGISKCHSTLCPLSLIRYVFVFNNSLAGQVTFTRTKFRTTAEVEDKGLVAEKTTLCAPPLPVIYCSGNSADASKCSMFICPRVYGL